MAKKMLHSVLVDRFAANIRKERERRKLSQEAFAAVIGVSQMYVSQLEAAKRAPSLDMLEKIATKLGRANPADLLKEVKS